MSQLVTEITVSLSNLYSAGAITTFEDEGEQTLTRTPLSITATEKDRLHTLMQGERLDVLAWRYYRDIVPNPGRWWWVIADANAIHNPLDLDDLVGVRLLIPDIARVKLLLPA